MSGTISRNRLQEIMRELAPRYFERGMDPRLDHSDILAAAAKQYYETEAGLSRSEASRKAKLFAEQRGHLVPFDFDDKVAEKLLAANKEEVGTYRDEDSLAGFDEDGDDLESVRSDISYGTGHGGLTA